MQQIYTPTQDYKVLVHTITFNQSKYITDTLDGVAMQQTNFPFVHYVIDDCSTDGEQDVIKAWINEHCDMDKAEYIELELANVILVPHNTNQSLNLAIYLLKRNLWKDPKLKGSLVASWREHCEYEAHCEGDDYWIDPLKLQKQVEFLDSHLDYGMCYSDFNIKIEKTGEMLCSLFKTRPDRWPKYYNSLEDFIYRRGYACPPSWVYRTSCIPTSDKLFKTSDITFIWFSYFLKTTKVYAFDEVMAVYRRLEESAAHTKSKEKTYIRNKNILDTQIKLIELYHLDPALAEKCTEQYYQENLMEFIMCGKDEDVKKAKREMKNLSLKQKIYIRMYFSPIRNTFFSCLLTLASLKERYQEKKTAHFKDA